MKKLQILPGNIANMIAAGEVVQRPASVVKELMENAVDAGADSISVFVTDSGRTLIRVIDNGCGMSSDDALLCFERHATSKIASAEDLESILTYGFRGEALPSIASVAEVTLVTRREGDETAAKVVINDFNHVSTSQVSAPKGTSISVRNIFFNTPARRKFLKSDNVELKHILEEFSHIALTHPEISFSLNHNGRDIHVLSKAKSLEFRISDLVGKGLGSDMIPLKADTSIARISGFAGQPSAAKKAVSSQEYFFVNGRYFRSAYLHKAVMKAYENFIPAGLSPSYFIYLEMDPRSMDVNIHPTKTEIKFEDDSVLFQTIFACVKESLGKSSFGAQIDFDTEGSLDIPVFSRSFDEFKPSPSPAADFDPQFNPFDYDAAGVYEPQSGSEGRTGFGGGAAHTGSSGEGGMHCPSSPVHTIPGYGQPRQGSAAALFEESPAGSSRILIIQGRYIIAPSASGAMIINVRRARERVLFDRFLQAFSQDSHISQKALFPVQVQVGAENRLIFDDNADLLGRLGFDIAPFGTDTIVVNGVPEGFSCEGGKIESMVGDLLRLLGTEDKTALPEMMAASMAQKFASLGACSAESLTNPFEAQRLLEALLSCQNAEFTAGGHRIISLLDGEEMEKRFR